MSEVCSGAALDRERRLWDAFAARDLDALSRYLDESLLDVGATGARLGRDGVIAAVGRMTIRSYALSDFRSRRSGDVEVVTYRADVDGSYDGAPFAHPAVRAETTWERRGRAWRAVGRRETPVEPRGGPG